MATLNYMWWLRIAIYAVFVLSGQSVAVLLGRLYYQKGGKSKWLATLVQPAGFPVLFPFLLLSPAAKIQLPSSSADSAPPSAATLASLYLFLGTFLAADCMLYSIGLLYLPVSTYSLICASQLGFNALFSFFLNSQKFTPFIVNSLFILTISSILLVFEPDSSSGSAKISTGKYAIGFVCTVGASAGYALILSVTQLSFRKILKKETFRVILDLIVYESLVATGVILVGVFASGDWKGWGKEMRDFELGKVSYVMTLVWTAISWQVFNIGAIGLIFEVSSLFSNVMSTLGLPIVPVAAVFIFQESMNGVKVVAMVLAIWGFVSYIYQHYLDDYELKSRKTGTVHERVDGVVEGSLVER
ncbi:Purine permease 21, partial [Sarracenia purpurea var. burkii]